MKISKANSTTAALCVALHRSSPRSTVTKLGLGGAMLALVAACSPAPMPVSQSSRDPSNPSAPEGASPVIASAAAPARPEQDGSGHEHHHHGSEEAPAAPASGHEGHGGHGGASATPGAESVVYVCPMHPEVTSNAPGICPKCNMKLVPKK